MYDYRKEEGSDPLFIFETHLGLTYYVAFRKMGTGKFPLDNLYSLDFDEIDKKKGKMMKKFLQLFFTLLPLSLMRTTTLLFTTFVIA